VTVPREPATSIILPTYQRAALLPRSIASVLAQSDGDFELIVVDDGSTDDTRDVVARLGDPRICYVALPGNRGLPAARNAGLAVARGRYVAFQDSDDEWLPEKLARQRRTLETRADADVVFGDMHRVCADGRVLHHRSPAIVSGRLVDPVTRYWQSYMLAMQPVMMRRGSLSELRFDEHLIRFEDLDLHLRVARRHTYLHVPEPVVRYHESGGLTVDWRAELRGRRQLLRKYARELLAAEPRFLVRETVDVLLRRSLLPIVDRHVTAL
jgi:glycosyltransferase involved in cell wall biosynthesis